MALEPSEKFKNKTESIKNVVLAIAVFIGGIWTLYTFWSLQSSNRAQAELEDLNARIFRQPVLQIDFELKQANLSNDKNRYVSGYVSVKNIGKRNALLKFNNNNPPFTVSEVYFDNAGNVNLGKKYGQYPPKYAGYSIRVGDTEKIPFFVRVGDPGLYFADFDVEVYEHNINDKSEESEAMSWTSSMYIEIK